MSDDEQRTETVDGGGRRTVVPPRLPERWEVLDLIGRGGQGVVWRARDRRLGQVVALKVIEAEGDHARRRWLREVRVGRDVVHPNLVRLFEIIESGELLVAVMEYVGCGSLTDRLILEGPQPLESVVRWLEQVLEVLVVLHARNIVHRDIKPSNLLLDGNGDVKLADLGLARRLDEDSDLTRTSVCVGTPDYMSPSQLLGGEPEPSWDLHALGVTACRLLTGEVPRRETDGRAHGWGPSVRASRPDCPRWLDRLVGRLMSGRRSERYTSASDALEDLRRRRARISPRHRRLAATLVLGAAVVIVGAAVGPDLVRRQAVRVTVDGDAVVGWSERERPVWRRSYGDRAVRAEVIDVTAGDTPEVVVSTWTPLEASRDGRLPAVEILTVAEELLYGFELADGLADRFPGVTPQWKISEVMPVDLTGDDRRELVFRVHDHLWFPAAVEIRELGETARTVSSFANSGWVSSLRVAELDGRAPPELVALGVNNALGYQWVVAVVRAVSAETGTKCSGLLSPDLPMFTSTASGVPEDCLVYVPLGSDSRGAVIESADAGGIRVRMDDGLHVLDRWGNLEGQPAFGSSERPRRRLWRELKEVCSRLEVGRIEAASGRRLIDGLRKRHPVIMDERPSVLAASLMVAEATARANRHDAAVEALRRALELAPDEPDLHLRLGEQLLILGRRAEGRAEVRRSLPAGRPGRTRYDQPLLLALDAAAHGDRPAFLETLDLIQAYREARASDHEVAFRMLWQFFQGRWGGDALCRAEAHSTHPYADVLQAWAAYRRGEWRAEVGEPLGQVHDTLEAEMLAVTVNAVLELEAGHVPRAIELCERVERRLAARGRVRLESAVWLPAVRLVHGRALAAAGRMVEARQELELARDGAPGTWIARDGAGLLASLGAASPSR